MFLISLNVQLFFAVRAHTITLSPFRIRLHDNNYSIRQSESTVVTQERWVLKRTFNTSKFFSNKLRILRFLFLARIAESAELSAVLQRSCVQALVVYSAYLAYANHLLSCLQSLGKFNVCLCIPTYELVNSWRAADGKTRARDSIWHD